MALLGNSCRHSAEQWWSGNTIRHQFLPVSTHPCPTSQHADGRDTVSYPLIDKLINAHQFICKVYKSQSGKLKTMSLRSLWNAAIKKGKFFPR